VDEVLGANTIAEMMHLDAAMRLASAKRLMAQGVTIFRPETCVIDAQVEVGADTVIEPYVQLLGATKIGEDCRIRSYSVIQSSTLGMKCWCGTAVCWMTRGWRWSDAGAVCASAAG
jgi:bifunctional UDP-N-acetylglucosamine pyrophosphorylase/glucosamine-1-phosphate N-acetyltransferase